MKKCKKCGKTDNLVYLQSLKDNKWVTFFLCQSCWTKDLNNEGTTFEDTLK